MANRVRPLALTAALLSCTFLAAAAPAGPSRSRVTALTVTATQPVGMFNGVAYTRTYGMVKGVIDPGDDVVGLAKLPKDAQGLYDYASEFEIVAPAAGRPANDVMFVDAENRGAAVMLNLLNEAGIAGPPSRAVYRAGIGNGFLQRHATSYARVQWQTKIARDVPDNAQGVGLVIMRDFARLLAGDTDTQAGGFNPGAYRTLILGGKSQSAWFVNDFIAEGFNVDPISGKGIFQGALSVDGIGHWMALNNLAAQHNIAEAPYIGANEKPLAREELLSRPSSDPILIDTAAYTDFYRLRASLTDVAATAPNYRRYDIPAPHAAQPPPVSRDTFGDCNRGTMMALNPISMSPYIRAQLVGVEKALGVKQAQSGPSLPPSSVFTLGPAPTSTANFNPLKGADSKVPLVDADTMPIGGVRFPDADCPLGKPLPVSVAPVITTSIDETCGNRGGFIPFSKAELAARYGSKEKYLELYLQGMEKLASQGFLLKEDEPGMLAYAAYLRDNAGKYLAGG